MLILRLMLFLGLFTFSAHSLAAAVCFERPPHTEEEKFTLADWAVGGAFKLFAEKAGVEFDLESYRNDCPNWGLFGYGYILGPACLDGVDVTRRYSAYIYAFNQKYQKNKEEFVEYYMNAAAKEGFMKYLILREDK